MRFMVELSYSLQDLFLVGDSSAIKRVSFEADREGKANVVLSLPRWSCIYVFEIFALAKDFRKGKALKHF